MLRFFLSHRREMKTMDISAFPDSPGVYLLKDTHGKVIYVGKARNLKQRLRSYFQHPESDSRRALPFLQRRVQAIDFIVTDSDKEALLLENTLIKKHQPRYNIKLRDDKTYLSLKIDTDADFPRLQVIRRRQAGDNARYFGPFSSSIALNATLRFVQNVFPLRMCKDSQFRNRSRPCLMYSVNKCLAPCVKTVSKVEYKKLVKGLILFLQGRRDRVIPLLQTMMHDYARNLDFEKAALIRDRISAIKKTIEPQKVSSYRAYTLDVIGIYRELNRVHLSVLRYERGLLLASRDFGFSVYEKTDPEIIRSFMAQFYGPEKYIPREILVPVTPEDTPLLESWLGELRGSNVSIRVPRRGEKREILRLARENARRKYVAESKHNDDREDLLEKVGKTLNMPRPPRFIECFDISHIMGSLSVGSMVSFHNGEPDKHNYRKFKIRSANQPNDYAMMKEVLERRYRRVLDRGGSPPDLILVDGGRGQLNIAVQVLKELDIGSVYLAAIAKGTTTRPLPGNTHPGRPSNTTTSTSPTEKTP